MFRLVCYDEEVCRKADWIYLCKTAGHTVAEGLRFTYEPESPDETDLLGILCAHFPPNFFQGFAPFVGMEDDTKAGIQFMMHKVNRMIQKMEDPEKDYTFDVFEEVLFAVAIAYVRDDIAFTKSAELDVSCPFLEKERERKVIIELVERFRYRFPQAKKMAQKVVQFHEMLLKEDEDSNLFFWDWDYDIFFGKTFIDGIHMLESFPGEQSGYGYEYACGIFTDIGMKAPLRLVGTREANKVANEVSRKKIMDSIDKLFPDDLFHE